LKLLVRQSAGGCVRVVADDIGVCAECIDTAWPHARFQKSAMSEYEKIFRSCKE
jgi:hypothetical protein